MKKGFTLIELMIVVVIIGILAAIAIPKFTDVSESAKRNACRANMRTIAGQEAIYFAQNSHYGTQTEIGLSGVTCPSAHPVVYIVALDQIGGAGATSVSMTITCPFTVSHGNINNGVASWHDSSI